MGVSAFFAYGRVQSAPIGVHRTLKTGGWLALELPPLFFRLAASVSNEGNTRDLTRIRIVFQEKHFENSATRSRKSGIWVPTSIMFAGSCTQTYANNTIPDFSCSPRSLYIPSGYDTYVIWNSNCSCETVSVQVPPVLGEPIFNRDIMQR